MRPFDRALWIQAFVMAVGLGCGACAPVTSGPEVLDDIVDDAASLANDDPSKILIYTSNLENLAKAEIEPGDPETCRGDWQDLVYFMANAEHAPDIVLFQQITSATQLDDKLVAKMEEVLGEEYGTIIAEADPEYWAPADCSAKHYQTNAIVYRKSRFTFVEGTKKTWRSKVSSGDGCSITSGSRYVNVSAKLGDKLHPHGEGLAEIAVASVHWPVEDGCGVTNAGEADEIMTSYTGAQLWVFGGDANLPELAEPEVAGSGYRPWYAHTNAALGAADNLGYVDPVYAACAAQSPAAVDACLIENATMRFGSRYDYLFAKYKPAYRAAPVETSGAVTVTAKAAGEADAAITGNDDASLAYSMHDAVGAYVHW